MLVLSATDDPHDLSEALKARASGYALKGTPTRTPSTPSARCSPESRPRAGPLHAVAHAACGGGRAAEGGVLGEALTLHETEMLRLTARGHTNLHIARALCISVSTEARRARLNAWRFGPHAGGRSGRRAGCAGEVRGVHPWDCTLPRSRDCWDGGHKVHSEGDVIVHTRGDQKAKEGPLGPCASSSLFLTIRWSRRTGRLLA